MFFSFLLAVYDASRICSTRDCIASLLQVVCVPMSGSASIGVRLEAVASLLDAVEELVSKLEISFCDVSGFGELEWVELSSSTGEAPVRTQGPLRMLDLKGRMRRAGDLCVSHFVCTASQETEDGCRIVCGELVAAAANAVELILTPLVTPGETGHPTESEPSITEELLRRPEQTASSEDTSRIEKRWANAVAESKRIERLARTFDGSGSSERPNRGDIVFHRQFGRCTVVSVDDEHITLRKPNRRNVQLGMPVLRFIPKDEEDGRRVFDIEIRSK